MLDIDTLGDYLRQNPGVMQDRIRIQSILRDIFPKDKLTVNLLLMGFEENIFSLLGQNHSEAELTRLANAIVAWRGIWGAVTIRFRGKRQVTREFIPPI